MFKPTLVIALLLALAASAPATAQMSPEAQAAQREAMAKLSNLAGIWYGQGWRYGPDGQKITYTETAQVAPQAGGMVYSIQGRAARHDGTPPGGGSFAIISYDPETKAYKLSAYGFGGQIDSPAELVAPDVFRWSIPAGPNTTMRFTVDVSKGMWDDLGERSTDGGATWTEIYGVKAYKVEDR